jgi:FkbM family methyltransferase
MTAVLQRLLIPRVFHRIWLGGPLPERERALGETWLRHHPGWQLRLWLDEDVPALANQALFDAAASMAQRADILRYEVLLAHGGVYVGADLECRRSIEVLLGGVELFCAREDASRVADAPLGCAPGHPLIAAVVAALPESVAWRPRGDRDERTGSDLLARVIVEQEALGAPAPTVFGPELLFPGDLPDAYAVRHRRDPWAADDRAPAGPASAPFAASSAPFAMSSAPPFAASSDASSAVPSAPPFATPSATPSAASSGASSAASSVASSGASSASSAAASAGAVGGGSEPAARIVVVVDPDLVEEASVVLAGAVEVAAAIPGAELALVVKGVPAVTAAVGDAMAGLLGQLIGPRQLPDVVVYSEPEGAALGATARVAMSRSPAENARMLLSLAAARPADESRVERNSMRGTYIGQDRMLIDLAYGGMLVVPSDDYSLMPSLVTWGAIEPPLTKFFTTAVLPGHTVVDIGANVGYFTVLAAKRVGPTGRVVAFEANPATCALLRDNLSLNWLTDHDVTIRNEAAHSENASIKFHASARFVGDSSTQERPEHEHRIDEITTIEVPAVRLDDALAAIPAIDLLKIDIEGGEYRAFLGMMGLIRERRIRRIVFEWNAVMLGEDRGRFVDVLRQIRDEHGGVFHGLDRDGRPGPVSIDRLTEVPFYPFALIDLP